MKVKLDDTICWNETCENFSLEKSTRCKYDCVGQCETQFDISFRSDSIKPKGECPWR